MTGWPANPKLVRHLKSTLIRTGVHVDEAVMGLSVHTDKDGGGDNPLLVARWTAGQAALGSHLSASQPLTQASLTSSGLLPPTHK